MADVAGMMVYDSVERDIYFNNGGAWVAMS